MIYKTCDKELRPLYLLFNCNVHESKVFLDKKSNSAISYRKQGFDKLLISFKLIICSNYTPSKD